MRRSIQKEPLYRKVNTRTHHHHHATGPDYRHDRNSKRETQAIDAEVPRGKMKQGVRRGLDYTPLFRFLLSKVGAGWSEVYSEARSRIDQEAPIFWLVARTEAEKKPVVRIGEASYFSGLYVDEAGTLALVDPNVKNRDLAPSCRCCTHTFNGEVLQRRFGEGPDHEGV